LFGFFSLRKRTQIHVLFIGPFSLHGDGFGTENCAAAGDKNRGVSRPRMSR
jgi:hypothetical protein